MAVDPRQILYPGFAMFYLTAVVLARLAYKRVTALQRREMDMGFYRLYQDGEEPDDIRQVTRHFINLFEMPVLFYVGIILVYITQQVNVWLVSCAWAYVALRYAHTAIHLGRNDVSLRFKVYFASGLALLVLWTSLLVQLLRS